MAEIGSPVICPDMAKGKRQIARDKRAAAAKQQKASGQPPPPATPAHGQIETADGARAAAAGNQQTGTQGPRECPVGTKRPSVDWHFIVATTEAVVSVCLLILAIAGALYAKGQLNAMREQNAVMIQQNRIMLAQQRPWIDLDAEPRGKPEAGKTWPIEFHFQNNGQSVANVVDVVFDVVYFELDKRIPGIGRLRISPGDGAVSDGPQTKSVRIHTDGPRYELDLDGDYKTDFRSQVGSVPVNELLAPETSADIVISKAWRLDEKMATGIDEGRVIPVLISAVTYTDASGEGHTTQVIGFYNPESGLFDRLPPINIAD